jgi:hypothetical protein
MKKHIMFILITIINLQPLFAQKDKIKTGCIRYDSDDFEIIQESDYSGTGNWRCIKD